MTKLKNPASILASLRWKKEKPSPEYFKMIRKKRKNYPKTSKQPVTLPTNNEGSIT